MATNCEDKNDIIVKETTNDRNDRRLAPRGYRGSLGMLEDFDRAVDSFLDGFYSPFGSINHDGFFDDFGLEEFRSPVTDVQVTDDAYVFRAEVPGLKASDITIEIDGGSLVIKGEKEEEEEKDGYFRSETRKFYRTVPLPDDALYKGDIEATLEDGMLDVKVRRKEAEPKITVDVKDKPAEKPAGTPVGTQAEKPAETPVVKPAEAPAAGQKTTTIEDRLAGIEEDPVDGGTQDGGKEA